MPINFSEDWLENGPVDLDERDEDGEAIEPDYCESCGKKIIAGCCACKEEDDDE